MDEVGGVDRPDLQPAAPGPEWHIIIVTPSGVAPTLDHLSLALAGGTPWKRSEAERSRLS